ncbi:SH3 domain protein [Acinetobacter nosocomialis]|nr:SH3 domain protein [Acinetobacter nosocomialis]
MIGSIEASYTDFGFIQAKGGGVNVRLNSNLSTKVTFKLKNDVAMTMIPIQHG